jgi:hypothetical protein
MIIFGFLRIDCHFLYKSKNKARKLKKTPKPLPAGRFFEPAERSRVPPDDAGYY